MAKDFSSQVNVSRRFKNGTSKACFQQSEKLISNFMNNKLDGFKVTDRQTFIKFLALLENDLLHNLESWETKHCLAS